MPHDRDWWESKFDEWAAQQVIQVLSQLKYKVALRAFLRFCGDREPSRNIFVSWMRDWSGSDMTIQSYSSSMRRFFEWLGVMGYYEDIGRGLKHYSRKQREHSRLPLTENQVDLLLAHLAEYNQPCRRDACMILLMMNCGLRCCEVVNAKIGDIYEHGDFTALRVLGKGHVYPDSYVALMPSLLQEINNYLGTRRFKQKRFPLFMTLQDNPRPLTIFRLGRICRFHLDQIGLSPPRYTAHSFRHTAAVLAMQRGESEESVSKMLRHVDPRTTRIYTKYVDRMRSLAERSLDFKLPDSTERKIIPLVARGNR